jgi:hypothetical protein
MGRAGHVPKKLKKKKKKKKKSSEKTDPVSAFHERRGLQVELEVRGPYLLNFCVLGAPPSTCPWEKHNENLTTIPNCHKDPIFFRLFSSNQWSDCTLAP